MISRVTAAMIAIVGLVSACGGRTELDSVGGRTDDPTDNNGGSGGATAVAATGGAPANVGGSSNTGTGGMTSTGGSSNTGAGGITSPGGSGGMDGSGGNLATGGSGADAAGGSGGEAYGEAAGDCSPGLTRCVGECVDLLSDPYNCGACGLLCGGRSDCSPDACGCEQGRTTCPAECDGALVCSMGACSSMCASGLLACGGSRVDLCTSTLDCGACGNTCPPGFTCNAGACVCTEGLTLCGAECVDLLSDPLNCGGCSNVCSTRSCVDGQCEYGPEGQSCSGMTGTECNGESCCTSIVVPGGTFPMGRSTETCNGCTDGCPSEMDCHDYEQPEHPVTVSSFAMDKYEVTVGRFRAFVEAYDGSPPPAGAGAHPLIAGSGWDSAWDSYLAASQSALEGNLTCHDDYPTWTSAVDANETYPINCVSWYEAFAFCIWDEGRLPTEAEWEYAAAGGSENRVYPWGNDVTNPLPANYRGTDRSPFVAVGSHSAGNGRWGHADLAGSMWEWMLDWHASDWYTTTEADCSDCANLTATSDRVVRGGYWHNTAKNLRSASRSIFTPLSPSAHILNLGFRCSRSAP